MPKLFLPSSLASVLIAVSLAAPAQASGALTGATEFTQILNNGELIALGGQNAEQIANQVTQISNQVEQIANQIRIYENMMRYRRFPDEMYAGVNAAEWRDALRQLPAPGATPATPDTPR